MFVLPLQVSLCKKKEALWASFFLHSEGETLSPLRSGRLEGARPLDAPRLSTPHPRCRRVRYFRSLYVRRKKPFGLLSSYIARGRLFLRSAPVGSRARVHWTRLASRHRTRGVVEFDTSGLFM